jgi:hypothetical protein
MGAGIADTWSRRAAATAPEVESRRRNDGLPSNLTR